MCPGGKKVPRTADCTLETFFRWNHEMISCCEFQRPMWRTSELNWATLSDGQQMSEYTNWSGLCTWDDYLRWHPRFLREFFFASPWSLAPLLIFPLHISFPKKGSSPNKIIMKNPSRKFMKSKLLEKLETALWQRMKKVNELDVFMLKRDHFRHLDFLIKG